MRYLEQEEHHEQLKQKTLMRWEEAINGKTVSHEAVCRWLDTWDTTQEIEKIIFKID